MTLKPGWSIPNPERHLSEVPFSHAGYKRRLVLIFWGQGNLVVAPSQIYSGGECTFCIRCSVLSPEKTFQFRWIHR